jgi:MoxR-like ATPase
MHSPIVSSSDAGQPIEAHAASAVKMLHNARQQINNQLAQVIVGQQEVIDQLLISIFSRGHCLLEGVPGLAKTLMVSTLARTLSLSFSRIQFTPDLMPADITGTEVIEEDRATGQLHRRFLEGPLFSNIVLADEINRTPPKTQAALLEAMQERQVSAGRTRHALADPFFVLATQNPLEQEGTYPLPEAQQDRFMFKVFVEYPSFDEELEIARRTTAPQQDAITPVLSGDDVLALQNMVRQVPAGEATIRYAVSLVRRTRPNEPAAAADVRQQISWGAGPRAVQFLILGAKARALLNGRTFAGIEDIRALAKPVLRHRVMLSFAAESDGVTTDDVISRLMDQTPVRDDPRLDDARLQNVFAA